MHIYIYIYIYIFICLFILIHILGKPEPYRRHQVSASILPFHDIAITSIVWCMAYKKGGGGVSYIVQSTCNSIAMVRVVQVRVNPMVFLFISLQLVAGGAILLHMSIPPTGIAIAILLQPSIHTPSCIDSFCFSFFLFSLLRVVRFCCRHWRCARVVSREALLKGNITAATLNRFLDN